ncbi:DUF6461 domain-containing protein [Nocardia tengchongensis]|uniref:DUF6461 domain-containing protein n=1 Tax=Nocardia tengchongensis TaxID=2055889 RepID=UPI0036AECB19
METGGLEQQQFAWIESDDRFDLGFCLTMVATDDCARVLDAFDAVEPRGTRRPEDQDFDDWLESLDDSDGPQMRHAGRAGGWTWVLEEITCAAARSPLPEQLSAQFGRAITVGWTVNLSSFFVESADGVILRNFELGRSAEPGSEGIDGHLPSEEGWDWEQWMSAGLCLQARRAGAVALPDGVVDTLISETCRFSLD